GPRITMLATASMNMPTMMNSRITRSSSASLSCVMATISSTRACGTRWKVMMRPSTTAAATIINAEALTQAVDVSESAGLVPETRADDHERYRRRDDRADDRRRGDERAGELARVLLLDHARDHDRRDGRGIRQRRARDSGQQHAGGDSDVRQPAADPAHEPLAE